MPIRISIYPKVSATPDLNPGLERDVGAAILTLVDTGELCQRDFERPVLR